MEAVELRKLTALDMLNHSIGMSLTSRKNEVGTVKLDWIQVNSPELKFPDVAKLGRDMGEWNRFVNPPELVSEAASTN